MGKKPGDREYYPVNQLKKKCNKKFFHGIHDRFIRDLEFRDRMIENNRDEELCRTWDALADEDLTHHLIQQEYSFYKSNWWLHSNKQGSNYCATRRRDLTSKSVVNFAAIENKEEGSIAIAHGLSQKSTMGTQEVFPSWWNWQGSWWTPYSESHEEDQTKY